VLQGIPASHGERQCRQRAAAFAEQAEHTISYLLQCVAVCCRIFAVCCSLLQGIPGSHRERQCRQCAAAFAEQAECIISYLLQCVAVGCSGLRYVAVCCSEYQRLMERCSAGSARQHLPSKLNV